MSIWCIGQLVEIAADKTIRTIVSNESLGDGMEVILPKWIGEG
jgi:hypothetical protein